MGEIKVENVVDEATRKEDTTMTPTDTEMKVGDASVQPASTENTVEPSTETNVEYTPVNSSDAMNTMEISSTGTIVKDATAVEMITGETKELKDIIVDPT